MNEAVKWVGCGGHVSVIVIRLSMLYVLLNNLKFTKDHLNDVHLVYTHVEICYGKRPLTIRPTLGQRPTPSECWMRDGMITPLDRIL